MRYLLVVLTSLLISPSIGWQGDRVRLKDVQVLTLRQGQYTTGRRSHPVPQLNCRGGSAGCRDAPSVVQCYNRGSDGRDVQWECKAEMKRTQKFGLIQVSCEGYDYPQDDYILVGSCGLEYYLEKTAHGHNTARKPISGRRRREDMITTKDTMHVVHDTAPPGREYSPKNAKREAYDGVRYRYSGHRHQSSGGVISLLLNVLFIAVPAFVLYAFCLCCMALCQRSDDISYQRLPGYEFGHRWRSNQPDCCSAPPPYNSTLTAQPYQYANAWGSSPGFGSAPHFGSAPGFGWGHSSGGGLGFWTGAASGGLLGYLYGSRNKATERTVFSSPGECAFIASSAPPSIFGDEPDDEYVSTGFGGTDRR